MTKDTMRVLTADEVESVAGGDYCPQRPCDEDEIKVGPVTVMKIPFYCNYWW
jgi:hypothetical protein